MNGPQVMDYTLAISLHSQTYQTVSFIRNHMYIYIAVVVNTLAGILDTLRRVCVAFNISRFFKETFDLAVQDNRSYRHQKRLTNVYES